MALNSGHVVVADGENAPQQQAVIRFTGLLTATVIVTVILINMFCVVFYCSLKGMVKHFSKYVY